MTRRWLPGEDGHEYGAYVPHPLAGWEPQTSRRVQDRLTAADADLAETARAGRASKSYQWAADSIMAQGESLSSSAIEGIYASLEGMSLADSDEHADEANRAALGNWEMAEQALDLAKSGDPLTMADLCDLHATLMERTDTPQIAGQIRKGPVWIGAPAISGMGPIGARFVPPPPEAVRPLLEDLVDYVNADDHSPALTAAVAHAQFETIHPFVDGNGRTGRALIQIALFKSNADTAIHLPISRSLLANRPDYYDALLSAAYEGPPDDPQRSASIEPWLALFSDSVQRAAEQARDAAARAEVIMSDWEDRLGGVRADSAVWKIASVMAYQPVFTAESIQAGLAADASAAAVRRGIGRLEQAGIVTRAGKSGKTLIYRAADMIRMAEDVLGMNAATADGADTQTGDTRSAGPPSRTAGSTPKTRTRPSARGAAPGTAWMCGHKGKRSKKRRIRRAGHNGQHRYP